MSQIQPFAWFQCGFYAILFICWLLSAQNWSQYASLLCLKMFCWPYYYGSLWKRFFPPAIKKDKQLCHNRLCSVERKWIIYIGNLEKVLCATLCHMRWVPSLIDGVSRSSFSRVRLQPLLLSCYPGWFNAPCADSLFCTENDQQPQCWSASKAEAAGSMHVLSFINEATSEWQPGIAKRSISSFVTN